MKPITIGVVALLVAAGAIVFIATREAPAPEAPAPVASAPATPPPARAAARTDRGRPRARPGNHTAGKESAGGKEGRARGPGRAGRTPTLASLTLDTDVPGASVFIDRQFVGTTPLSLDKLEPGTKR